METIGRTDTAYWRQRHWGTPGPTTNEEWQAYWRAERADELAQLDGDAGPARTIQEHIADLVAIDDDDPPGGASYEDCLAWQDRYWRSLRLLHHTRTAGAYDDLDDASQLLGVLTERASTIIDRADFDEDDWWGDVWEITIALKAALTCPEIQAFVPEDLTGHWHDYWREAQEETNALHHPATD